MTSQLNTAIATSDAPGVEHKHCDPSAVGARRVEAVERERRLIDTVGAPSVRLRR